MTIDGTRVIRVVAIDIFIFVVAVDGPLLFRVLIMSTTLVGRGDLRLLVFHSRYLSTSVCGVNSQVSAYRRYFPYNDTVLKKV